MPKTPRATALTTAPTTPSTAERIRSACAGGGGGAMLVMEGVEPVSTPVHHLFDDGSFAVTIPVDVPLSAMVVSAGTGGVQAVLAITDYAPLPLREPVRSLVWVHGRPHAVPSADVSELLDLFACRSPNPLTT